MTHTDHMRTEITYPSPKLRKRENLVPPRNFWFFTGSAIPDNLHHKCRPENCLRKRVTEYDMFSENSP